MHGSPNTVRVRFYYETRDSQARPLGDYTEIDVLSPSCDLPRRLNAAPIVVIIKEIALSPEMVCWILERDDDVMYDGTTLYVKAVTYDEALRRFLGVIARANRRIVPFPGPGDDGGAEPASA